MLSRNGSSYFDLLMQKPFRGPLDLRAPEDRVAMDEGVSLGKNARSPRIDQHVVSYLDAWNNGDAASTRSTWFGPACRASDATVVAATSHSVDAERSSVGSQRVAISSSPHGGWLQDCVPISAGSIGGTRQTVRSGQTIGTQQIFSNDQRLRTVPVHTHIQIMVPVPGRNGQYYLVDPSLFIPEPDYVQ